MKRRGVVVLLVSIVVAAGLVPVKVPCGAPGATCATAPDENGDATAFYEIEPVAVMMLEGIARRDLPLRYARGEDKIHFGLPPGVRPSP